MAVRRFGFVLVLSLVLSSLVIVASPWPVPDADADVGCIVSNETELAACINTYNAAALAETVTATFSQNITLTAALPIINNTSGAWFIVEGAGFVLDGAAAAGDVLSQASGTTAVRRLTVTGSGMVGNSALFVSNGLLTITRSTITGNVIGVSAVGASTALAVEHSTIANNGGALYVATGTTASIDRTTIAGSDGMATLMTIDGSATFTGSLIHAACGGASLGVDGGGNVASSDSCLGPGTGSEALAASVDTMLADNGCFIPCTQTLALRSGSPALDANGGCLPGMADQRGALRESGACDAGSFELGDCTTPIDVGDEAAIAFVIGCYNLLNVATTIHMTGPIFLTKPLPNIDNRAASPAVLTLNGHGETLNSDDADPSTPFVPTTLTLFRGSLSITDLHMIGGTGGGAGHLLSFGTSLDLNRVTLDGQNAGLVVLEGTSHVSNSTIFDQFSDSIYAAPGVTMTVDHSTVYSRFSQQIFGGAAVTMTGSLVANTGSGDACHAPIINGGGTLASDASCTGVASPTLTGSLRTILGTNGCTEPCAPTQALLPGSPAIDADSGCVAGFDQRGVARTAGMCDAGSFEFGDLAAVTCDGLTVTINMQRGSSGTGTAGNDVILGTAGNDMIDALGGDDTVCAGAGNDQVLGGDGNDRLFGEAGADLMRGGPGNDTLEGSDGNDRLLGGIDNDVIRGGDGNDYIGGFGGNDVIFGDAGDETIFGGFGADTIDGGPGNDVIRGLIGDDTIIGGDGNDRLDGDRGNDRLDGGQGNDIIGGGNASDILNGDAGDDHLSGGKADDALSGGTGDDVCIGNLETTADTADATCETILGVP